MQRSEHTAVIFLLYDTNADDTDTKEDSQNGDGEHDHGIEEHNAFFLIL